MSGYIQFFTTIFMEIDWVKVVHIENQIFIKGDTEPSGKGQGILQIMSRKIG